MKRVLTGCVVFFFTCVACRGQLIIDHSCTDITAIPTNWISQARQDLHIAYGHTSHGSQLTTGMSGLVDFANGGGKGLSVPADFFAWNNGGTGGALDLHDYAMGGDVGYWPQWLENTTNYLNNPSHADVNIVMWSWCGQVESHYTSGILTNAYLAPMSQLELEYPDVTFVYMTGHVDIWDDANNKAANNVIRKYCLDHDKVLYDFADIERYNPDGHYFEFVNDNCDYYAAEGGTYLGNWATEWQNTHTEDIDWYDCGAAHSVSLNANQKAYAAWWMFARLAGWSGDPEYDSWCVNYFSAEEITDQKVAGKYADPDGDRIPNVYERALATNPMDANTFQIKSQTTTNGFDVIFSRAENISGYNFASSRNSVLS